MVKPMAADLGWSRSAISAAIFLNMAVYAVSLLITGRLYDRYGPKWILAVSSLLFSVGYMLMATMGSLWEFYLYFGVLNAAGLGGTTTVIDVFIEEMPCHIASMPVAVNIQCHSARHKEVVL